MIVPRSNTNSDGIIGRGSLAEQHFDWPSPSSWSYSSVAPKNSHGSSKGHSGRQGKREAHEKRSTRSFGKKFLRFGRSYASQCELISSRTYDRWKLYVEWRRIPPRLRSERRADLSLSAQLCWLLLNVILYSSFEVESIAG